MVSIHNWSRWSKFIIFDIAASYKWMLHLYEVAILVKLYCSYCTYFTDFSYRFHSALYGGHGILLKNLTWKQEKLNIGRLILSMCACVVVSLLVKMIITNGHTLGSWWDQVQTNFSSQIKRPVSILTLKANMEKYRAKDLKIQKK